MYDLGRPDPDGRLGPDLDLRRRPPEPDPGQGQGPDRRCRRSGSPRRATSSPTTCISCHRRRAGRGPRPRAWSSQARDAARRVRRARLHHGLGLEGLPGDRRASRASSCRRACASPSSCPSRSSRPSTKAEVGHDEAIDFDQAAELVGDRDLMEPPARRLDRALPLRRRARARARRDPRRHEVRVRPRRRRRARRRRRGADAGLLALLAGRRLRAGPRPAELRQAVRARLGVRDRLGQDAAGARDPATTSSQGTRDALRRGLRADHRRAVRRLARSGRRA